MDHLILERASAEARRWIDLQILGPYIPFLDEGAYI